jgi:hypothetical protein
MYLKKYKCAPVLYLFYNRIEKTKLSFAIIQKIKPSKLYLASDGPKNSKDFINVKNVRNYILNNINWECKIEKLFYNENKGLKSGISNSIAWFFSNEESGIILEDDLLPEISFFQYASELLLHYKKNKNIGMISGNNYVGDIDNDSYYFSKYASCWGWATWSDRWKCHYDPDMKKWKNIKKRKNSLFMKKNDSRFIKIFDLVYDNKINTWDYQWMFAMLNKNLLQITPKVNLVTNIGFGNHATNTHSKFHWGANRSTTSINFPLIHPKKKKINYFYDNFYLSNFLFPTRFCSLKNKIKIFIINFLKIKFIFNYK